MFLYRITYIEKCQEKVKGEFSPNYLQWSPAGDKKRWAEVSLLIAFLNWGDYG